MKMSGVQIVVTAPKEVWQSLAYCTGLENRRTLIVFPGFESLRFRHYNARLAQLVERGLYTADVRSSSLLSRTILRLVMPSVVQAQPLTLILKVDG